MVAAPSPRRPAPAGQPRRPAAAQNYSTCNVKQQPQTWWWAPKNIPRANLMRQANMQDQSLGHQIAPWNFRRTPGREHFGPAVALSKYSKPRGNISRCRRGKHKSTHLPQTPRASVVYETSHGDQGRAQAFSSSPPARAFSGPALAKIKKYEQFYVCF